MTTYEFEQRQLDLADGRRPQCDRCGSPKGAPLFYFIGGSSKRLEGKE